MRYTQYDLLAVVIAKIPPSYLCPERKFQSPRQHDEAGGHLIESLTPDFGVGSLLTIADIDKIEGCLRLSEAEEEVLHIVFVVDGAVALHGFTEAIQISNNLSDDFNFVGNFALFGYSLSKGGRCFLSPFKTLFDIFFFELRVSEGQLRHHVIWWDSTGWLGGLTIKPSPSTRTIT